MGELPCPRPHRNRTRRSSSRPSTRCSTGGTTPPPSGSGRNATFSTATHIAPGRDGLFNLIRTLPATLKYENQLIVAERDYVVAHGRFSGNDRPAAWVAADIVRIEDGRLAEHWDVFQDEATEAQSLSGLPMFGDRFPD
jgi:hypothetical protein